MQQGGLDAAISPYEPSGSTLRAFELFAAMPDRRIEVTRAASPADDPNLWVDAARARAARSACSRRSGTRSPRKRPGAR